MRVGLTAALAGAACLFGCTVIFPLDGLTGGGTVAPTQPVLVVSAGMVTAPTGNAQQVHAFWAANAKAWVLVYLADSDPMALHTASSPDFATWTTSTITQPVHGSIADGRDFSLAAKNIAGTDVVHLVVSEKNGAQRQHEHARGHVDPKSADLGIDGYVQFTFTTLAQPALDPDGPSTAVTVDDHVVELSSWYDDGDGGAGDSFGWVSTDPDPGSGAWPMGFDQGTELQMVHLFVNSRAAVALGSGDVLALWDKGDQEPTPTNVFFSRFQGGMWTPFDAVFDDSEGADMDHDDWGVARRQDDDVHAVRRTRSGEFEHRRYNGMAWTTGEPIPNIKDSGKDVGAIDGGGLVVTTDGTTVTLFAIAASGGNPIEATTWKGSWGDWRVVVGPGGNRSYLSAAQGPSGRTGLLWTEGTPNGTFIEAALVPGP
jgi:hypothetical protein